MGQIPSNPVVSAPQVASVEAIKPLTADERSLNQSVANAVRRLNQSGAVAAGREVTFALDPKSMKTVVKVVDSQSGEVITQWPAEYALRLSEYYFNQK